MYWETPGNRTDENDYVLLAREESDTMIDKIATSAPVAAISDFNKAFLDLLISSIGFVAALSWNDYIKSLFQKGGVFYERVGSGGVALCCAVHHGSRVRRDDCGQNNLPRPEGRVKNKPDQNINRRDR